MQVLARLFWIGLLACLTIQVMAVEQNYEEAAERLAELMRAGREEIQTRLNALRGEPNFGGRTTGAFDDIEPESAQAGRDGAKRRWALRHWSSPAKDDILPYLQRHASTKEEVRRLRDDEQLLFYFHLLAANANAGDRGLKPGSLDRARNLLVGLYLKDKNLPLAFQQADDYINLSHWDRGYHYAEAIRLFPLASHLLVPDTPWHLELLHKAALEATSLHDGGKTGKLSSPDVRKYREVAQIRRNLRRLLTKSPGELERKELDRRDEMVQRFAKAYMGLLREGVPSEPSLSRKLIERLAKVPPLHPNGSIDTGRYVSEAIENVRLQESTRSTGPTHQLAAIAGRKKGKRPLSAAHEAAPGSGPEAHPEHGSEGYGTDQADHGGQGYDTEQAHQGVPYYGASTVAQHQGEPDNYQHAGQDHVEAAPSELNRPVTPQWWSSDDVYRPQRPTPPPSYDGVPSMPPEPKWPPDDVDRRQGSTSPAGWHGPARSSRHAGDSNRATRSDTVRIESVPTSPTGTQLRASTELRASTQDQSMRPVATSQGQTQSMADASDAVSRRPGQQAVTGAVENMSMHSIRRSGAESGYLPDVSKMPVSVPRRVKTRRRRRRTTSSDEAESRISAGPAYGDYRGEDHGPHGAYGPPPAGAYGAYGPPPVGPYRAPPWQQPYPGATAHYAPRPHDGYGPGPPRHYPAWPYEQANPNAPPPRSGYFAAPYGHPRPYPP